MARKFGGGGRFGGKLARDAITISVDVPFNMRLRFDGEKVAQSVGRKVASKIRRKLKKGEDYDGNALPVGKDGGPGLNDTGRLIKSIKYRKGTATIEPTGKREDVSKRAGGNFGLLSIHIQTRDIDPLGTGSGKQLDKDLNEQTEKEIAKQIKSGKATLVGELRRAVGGGRRRR